MCDYRIVIRKVFRHALGSGNTTYRKVFDILSYVTGASCSYFPAADIRQIPEHYKNVSNTRYPNNVFEIRHFNRVEINSIFWQLADLKYGIQS